MIVHLIDGTYELFRHFYGQRSWNEGKDKPLGAVAGVLHSVLEMVETGATHVGVATDHVIESFRNDLWPDYKTGEGIDRVLNAQFLPLEDALAAMGVAVWPMIELEADDGLASAAYLAAKDPRVEKVCIWANDKDLAQCVRGDRVVQIIRKGMQVRDAEAVRAKFGVEPPLIPDFLALVGDSQDGYPGVPGIGKSTAASLLNKYGPIESFPPDSLGAERDHALLFKTLATLKTGAPLFADVDEMEWKGPTPAFTDWATRIDDKRLLARAEAALGVRDKRAATAPRGEQLVNEAAPPS
jgi:5'-3' exonuclease